MLKQLIECDFLPTCEYWCFDHSKVERFDDSKCKRCLGHPSRRRKMLHLAKNFFSSLGHKSKKAHDTFGFPADDTSPALPPPPSYDEINSQIRVELSATEIAEIDSTELLPEASIDPQALLLPELESTSVCTDAFMQWQPSPLISEASLAAPEEQASDRSPMARPCLQVNTQGLEQFRQASHSRPRPRPIAPPAPRSKVLSPSSSVRSTTSTTRTMSTMTTISNVSSVISPISNWSHGSNTWSSGFETSLTSPATDVAGLGDLPPPETTFTEGPGACNYGYPLEFPHDVFSELPADMPLAKTAPADLSSDPLLFSFDPALCADMSYNANVDLAEDIGDSLDLASAGIEESIDCYSETTSMVASSWDLLMAHIASSMDKTLSIGDNLLAEQLRSLAPESITAAGFRALRNAIDGFHPTSAIDTLCLIHLVYALSFITFGQDANARCTILFVQSLSYAQFFPLEEQGMYTEVATAIWQPSGFSQAQLDQVRCQYGFGLQRSSSQKGKDARLGLDRNDHLVNTAQSFLDGKSLLRRLRRRKTKANGLQISRSRQYLGPHPRRSRS